MGLVKFWSEDHHAVGASHGARAFGGEMCVCVSVNMCACMSVHMCVGSVESDKE